ncbi:GNAT family N-acetyltransferase [Streptococcus pluranimalium]
MLFLEKLAEFSVFETDRLLLRPFQFQDLEQFSEIVLDQQVMAFIHPGIKDREGAKTLLVSQFMMNPLGKWAIVDKVTEKLIGAIRFENTENRHRKAEIGYFLHKDYWRQGIMTECVKTLAFLAFQEFGLRTLKVLVHEENIASRKLAESCQFKLKEIFKGSDRYSHKVRRYCHLELNIEDYRYE